MVFKKLARRKAANKPAADKPAADKPAAADAQAIPALVETVQPEAPSIAKSDDERTAAAPAEEPSAPTPEEPFASTPEEPFAPTPEEPAKVEDKDEQKEWWVGKAGAPAQPASTVPDPLINVLLKSMGLMSEKPKQPSEDIEEEKEDVNPLMDPMAPSPLPPQALDGCGPGIMSGFVEKMNSFTIVQPLQPQIADAQEQAPGSPEKRQHKAVLQQVAADVPVVEVDSSHVPPTTRPVSTSDASSEEEDAAQIVGPDGAWEKRQAKAETRKAKKEQKALARQQKKEEKRKKKEERKAAKAAKLNSKKNSRAHKPALTAEAP